MSFKLRFKPVDSVPTLKSFLLILMAERGKGKTHAAADFPGSLLLCTRGKPDELPGVMASNVPNLDAFDKQVNHLLDYAKAVPDPSAREVQWVWLDEGSDFYEWAEVDICKIHGVPYPGHPTKDEPKAMYKKARIHWDDRVLHRLIELQEAGFGVGMLFGEKEFPSKRADDYIGLRVGGSVDEHIRSHAHMVWRIEMENTPRKRGGSAPDVDPRRVIRWTPARINGAEIRCKSRAPRGLSGWPANPSCITRPDGTTMAHEVITNTFHAAFGIDTETTTEETE